MKRTVIAISAVLIAVAYIGMLVAQAPKASANDPSLGTWVLNAQRSNFGGGPAPKAFIERYDMRPDGFIVSTRSVIANDDSPAFEQAVFKYDGKDYEWWDNVWLAEFLASGRRAPKTLSVKSIDAYTVEYAVKQAGKIIATSKRTVSRDGKTMTLTAKAFNTTQSQSVDVVGVFEKR
jgi:hypothetical protein